MDAFILYFFKVNIAFFALYLFYRLFLHRDTFFREKRFAFLFAFAFALLYPVINLSTWIQSNRPATTLAQTLGQTLPEVTVNASQQNGLSANNKIFIAYGLILAILLIRILWQVGTVCFMAIHGRKVDHDGIHIIRLQQGAAPFSFFGWIFINPEEHGYTDLEEIMHHEKAHARQFHTLDVLFSEMVCAIFWINPFAWLLKHHLRQNLEYLADMDVLHSGFDPKSYQYHLLRLSYQQNTTKMGNNFNVSQLKKRIIMMNKKRTSLAGLSKYALSLPIFALLFLSAYAWGTKHEIVSMNDIAAIAETSPQVSNTAQKAKQTSSKDKAIEDKNAIKGIDQVVVVGYANDKTPASESTYRSFSTMEAKDALLQAEQMPEFPGGLNALMKFISSNLRYPVSAVEAGIEGRTYVRFIVSQTGEVKNVQTAKGFNPACDEEAIRVVKMMPKWIPGKDKGKKVPVYYTLPVLYKLQRTSTKSTSLASMAEKDAPLYIVDGVIKDKKYVDEISPNIESISVLKDSTATRQYGENGKNGVILITSKKTSK